MRDSADSKPGRVGYVAPKAVSLRDSETGFGGNCESGSAARGHCGTGSMADGNQCVTGGEVHGRYGYGLDRPGMNDR